MVHASSGVCLVLGTAAGNCGSHPFEFLANSSVCRVLFHQEEVHSSFRKRDAPGLMWRRRYLEKVHLPESLASCPHSRPRLPPWLR